MRRKAVIFGAGYQGRLVLDCLVMDGQDSHIECLVDNDPDKWNTEYRRVRVHPPEHLRSLDVDIVVAIGVQEHAQQVEAQLESEGYKKGVDYFTPDEYWNIEEWIRESFAEVRKLSRGLHSGFSHDRKYKILDEDGKTFCLRTYNFSRRGNAHNEFEAMKFMKGALESLESEGFFVPKVFKFGYKGVYAYILQEWVEGDILTFMLPVLNKQKHYEYGYRYGAALRLLHVAPVPDYTAIGKYAMRDGARYNINMYRETEPQFFLEDSFEECFVSYIRECGLNIENRPECFIHGSVVSSHLLVDKNERLCLMDYKASGVGDPWHDLSPGFIRCAVMSPVLASGLLHGYFGGNPPPDFWDYLALYASEYGLHVSRSLKNLKEDYDEAVGFFTEKIEFIHRYVSRFKTSPVPEWYHDAFGVTCGMMREKMREKHNAKEPV